MLDPKKDVLIYSDYLKPPIGFEFSKAISTTYSLDLKAILFLPVALYFSKDIETNKKNNEGVIAVLDALSRISKQVSIYCQDGKILVPEKYNKLMSYWEENIHQVRMPNATSSFHPKIWLIRFQNQKKTKTLYRFICTSRNLTLNRDWDVAFIVDGKVSKKSTASTAKNKPLQDFLKYLDRQHAVDSVFLDEVLKIEWEGTETFDFKPILNDGVYENPLTSQKEHSKESLVITPFIDKRSLEIHKKRANSMTILSRSEELNCIDSQSFKNHAIYSFNHAIIDGEQSLDTEGEEDNFTQQLHAKYYIDVFDKHNHIYLGSANMTCPASRDNIEFLVREKNYQKGIIKTLLSQITNTPDKKGNSLFNIHEFVEAQESDGIDELQLRRIIYELCSISFKGTCKPIEDKLFNLSTEILGGINTDILEDLEITIRSLPDKSNSQILLLTKDKFDLGNYQLSELSSYLLLSFNYKGQVKEILMKMDVELPEERANNIFKAILDSQEKLLSHISFLLNGEELGLMSFEDIEADGSSMLELEDNNGIPFLQGVNLYEDLMVATSRNPGQFEYINNLLLKLTTYSTEEERESSVVSDDFMEIWNVFYAFSKT